MGLEVTPLKVAVVAGGAGLTFFLLARRGEAAEIPLPQELPHDLTVDVPRGWHGEVVELSTIKQPSFPNTTAGHIAFVKYMIPVLMSLGMSHESAVLFTAHKARETGWGKAVFRYNFGNIKVGSPMKGPYFWLTDRRGFRDKYRAYYTPEDGIQDNITLIQKLTRYRKSWAMLQAGDISWYGQLGLDGYYEGPPNPSRPGTHTVHTPTTVAPVQREYAKIVALVHKYEASPGAARALSAAGASIQAEAGAGSWAIAGLVLGGLLATATNVRS